MGPATAIRALILDFGEVLVRPQSAESIRGMAQLAKLDPEEFRQRYWHHRSGYDEGRLSGTEYWRQVVNRADIRPADLDDAIAALKHADYLSWTDYRQEMWDLTMDFKRRGRTAILSNGVPEIMGRVRTDRPLGEHFDAVIISCEVGCAKPHPRIYQRCLSALGVPAASALFVDDRRENLDAALRLGLQVFHFTGDGSVAELQSRLTP